MARVKLFVIFAAAAACCGILAQEKPTLYVVPYAHLDTQWRWAYPQVIREFLWNTMEDNFKLFAKYPNYKFNFGGSRRFEMMKEYFPAEYKKVVGYVKAGRWFPAPASVDETEVNIISGESVIRNILYGNEFYKKEFGVTSSEFMRPDSFGFPYSLPTLLSHAGLKGFSTQKLSWGSAVGIPFNVGVWIGPDGSGILAALNPTSYGSSVDGDLSEDPKWLARVQADPIPIDYRYYGTGDVGGAPKEPSVANAEKSVLGNGPLKIIQGAADAMFKSLTAAQISKLPRYRGELLLTQHSAGSLSSHSEMKRWNRMNELLADLAERSSVAASLWAGAEYPKNRLNRAWDLVLGSQMHDMLPGTCLPKAYEYAQNDEIIAMNTFAAVATDAVGAVSSEMDTRVKGSALLVVNPLSIARTEIVEAKVDKRFENGFTVYGPDGKPVPTGAVVRDKRGGSILFLATVPANGFAAYDLRPGFVPPTGANVKATERSIENDKLRVTVNDAGDISSIYDKRAKRETLSSPIQLDLQYENPQDWPAWNMDWKDQKLPPRAHVGGKPIINLIHNSPVRSTIQVQRKTDGSLFVQDISLDTGADFVRVVNNIDWATRETALKAAFHLAAANPKATYGMQVGAIERGNNDPKKYEVPVHGWMDLTSADGKHGVGILSPFKYGSDKPSDDTLRLTLIYTPGTHGGYQDQGYQDFGKHSIVYGIQPHEGSRAAGKVAWAAARLAQPMRVFAVPSHPGTLGRVLSLASVNSGRVEVSAIKQAEDGNGAIVRLRELTGSPAQKVELKMAEPIDAAEIVDGQEHKIGNAKLAGGKVRFDIKGYGLVSLRVHLKRAGAPKAKSVQLQIPFDLDVVSMPSEKGGGAFDNSGVSYSGDMLPKSLALGGVKFNLGPSSAGANNAMRMNGQTIALPKGYSRIYLLAASTQDENATLTFGKAQANVRIPSWTGYVGQWDTRLWDGKQPEEAFDWKLPFAGLAPGYIKNAEVAWYASHGHLADGSNNYYVYTYLFKFGFDTHGATTLKLPKSPNIKIFAISAANDAQSIASPATGLMDDLHDHLQSGSPEISASDPLPTGGVNVTITPPLYYRKGEIRYTLDDSAPSPESPEYNHDFYLGKDATVTAAVVDASGRVRGSNKKRITVTDRVAPKVVGATVYRGLGIAEIRFSEKIDPAFAVDTRNYSMKGAVMRSASVDDSGRGVSLTFEPNADGATMHVLAKDMAGNRIDADVAMESASPIFTAPPLEPSKEATFSAALPDEPGKPWTINFWLRVDKRPADLTLIAGFGTPTDGRSGRGRYLVEMDGHVQFWASNQDVTTETAMDIGTWQMLTAAYDGSEVRVYKNGSLIGSGKSNLSRDSGGVYIMPIDAWDKKRRLDGEIRGFEIWGVALPAAAVNKLYAKG
ncbi:MAG TPA: glycoside hydrolase family 38 C-terminal domain-containing protein [Fimbriimonadales bacterium]|nr:glycoside hydrolase family 38 C-terminal domain-containing protein [Fimbriimonadales bacterium]